MSTPDSSRDQVLDGVLADLAAEGDALEALVAGLDDAGWRTATPAEGWTVAHQVAHLAWTDEAAVAAAHAGRGEKDAWDALVTAGMANIDGFVDDAAEAGAQAAPADLLERWRTGRTLLATTLREHPRGEKLPWFGPPMSPTSMASARFMETWAHTLDVAEGLEAAGLGRVPEPSDRVRHVCHLGVRTRGFSFATHGEEVPPEPRVELVAPSGEVWAWGPEDAAERVTGSAQHFALRVTQRRHRDDLDLVATGAGADRWLEIAQAFAGPPGSGREPGGTR